MKLRLAIVLCALLPILMLAVAVPRFGDGRWAEMSAWADRQEEQWRARDYSRVSAFGATVDGAAAGDYEQALELTRALGKDDRELSTQLRQEPEKVAVATADAFVRRWRTALLAMTAGAHRRDARPAVHWAKGFWESADLLPARDLVNAATIVVRRRVAAGESRAAVELLLDALSFAVDLRLSPRIVDQMIASAALQIGAAETMRDGELRDLDSESLALLATGLERLDARWASAFDGGGETLLLARTLIGRSGKDVDAAEPVLTGAGPGLRYGWSQRWAEADAVMTLAAANERAAVSLQQPWPERRAHLDAIVGELQRHKNGYVRTAIVSWSSVEFTLRMAQAHLRLLRLAVAQGLGDATLDLGDPLAAGMLQREQSGTGFVVRSAGGTSAHPIERATAAR